MIALISGMYRESVSARIKLANRGRVGFVIEAIRRQHVRSMLDIGSGEGWVVGDDALAGVPRRVGVDTDSEILARAQGRYPSSDFRLIDGGLLPFGDGEFDAVVLSDVIEHVGDKNKQRVIDEALRVLGPGGCLVLTAPHRGVWAPLDPLDAKRRFPRLYRLTRRQPLTPAAVGHKHVTLDEIRALLSDRATIEVAEYSGWCAPLGDAPLLVALLLHHRGWLSQQKLWAASRWQTFEASLPAPKVVAGHLRLVARRCSELPYSVSGEAGPESSIDARALEGNENGRRPQSPLLVGHEDARRN